MSRETIVVPDAVKEAIETFRGSGAAGGEDEAEATRFLTLSYADKRTLEVVGQGPGGLDEAAAACKEREGNYILLRLPFKVEISQTIKYAYVDYVPEGTSPMRRALLSTHKGQVEDLLKPFHVSIQASDEGDLDMDEIMDRLGASSGTKSWVTTRGAARGKPAAGAAGKAAEEEKKERSAKREGAAMVPSSIKNSRAVNVEDEDALRAAIADVRDDASETTWCLVSYSTPTSLALVASGGGTVAALREAMSDPSRFYYALFRTSYLVDESDCVRFGFVRVVSDQVSPMQRGRISTHIGFVKELFGQYHHEFTIDDAASLTEADVDDQMRSVMGLKSRVGDAAPADGGGAAAAASPAPAQAKAPAKALATDSALSFGDEDAFRAAMAGVHADASDTTWALSRYSSKHTLTLVATGTGDAGEMLAAVGDGFHVGIVRLTEQIDASVTVKFALVKIMDPSVRPMVRGEINTVIGKIERLHEPYHVDMIASSPDEISAQDVADKVAKASMAR